MSAWAPPAKIEELYEKTGGGKFGGMNRPTAGARSEDALPEGKADIQLYSIATPNGWKVGILLEELGVDYDAHVVNIMKLDQFKKGFVEINPNSKIPAAVDKAAGPAGDKTVRLFESGAIMMYLAEKYEKFMPAKDDVVGRAEVLNWVFWQMAGQGPMTGNFGHFFAYAPEDKCETRDYGTSRYGMETQRLCSVLDQHLEGKDYIVGGEYSVADMACFPWFHQIVTGYKFNEEISANSFLNPAQYKNLMRWHGAIFARPAVKRGLTVCNWQGVGKPWLEEQKA